MIVLKKLKLPPGYQTLIMYSGSPKKPFENGPFSGTESTVSNKSLFVFPALESSP
jgi:hypothetical protein